MTNITLPDGKKIKFDKPVTGTEVAEKISKSLAKQALVMSVDGELKDLYFSIKKDSSVQIFTAKDPEGLEVIRHDTAHIMACLLYTSPSPRDGLLSRMPSSA